MQHKELDFIDNNLPKYKKDSNKFIGAMFAVMFVLIMIGVIFG